MEQPTPSVEQGSAWVSVSRGLIYRPRNDSLGVNETWWGWPTLSVEKDSRAGLYPSMGTLRRPWNDPLGTKETRWTSRLCQRKKLVARVSVSRGTLRRPRNDPLGVKETRWTGRIRWSGNREKRLVLSHGVVTLAHAEPPPPNDVA